MFVAELLPIIEKDFNDRLNTPHRESLNIRPISTDALMSLQIAACKTIIALEERVRLLEEKE